MIPVCSASPTKNSYNPVATIIIVSRTSGTNGATLNLSIMPHSAYAPTGANIAATTISTGKIFFRKFILSYLLLSYQLYHIYDKM